MTKSVEAFWRKMKRWCLDTKHREYPRYGGCGVRLCERWHDLETFLVDIGKKPSGKHYLDREDFLGDFEPGNFGWVSGEWPAEDPTLIDAIALMAKSLARLRAGV